MAQGREVVVRILGDADKLKQAFGEADDAGRSFGDKMKATGKKMQGVGMKMSIGLTAPIAAAGVKMFQTASDMGESMSKVSTIFGDSGDEMLAWSKTTGKALGLPRQAALDAAGTFGNMFTQLGIGVKPAAKMSKEMVGLASDFASFHNEDPTSVLESMSAAFRGEYDALQKYVPTINAAAVEQKALALTGKATTKELTAQDKALATQALMLEGAGTAAGDFARTSDSAANKQKILSARFADAAALLGEKLLPVGQQIIDWASGLMDKFSNLSPNVQKFILIGGGLLAVLGPIVAVVGTLVTVIGFLLSPIGLVVLAIVALVAGFVWAYKNVEWFRDGVDAVVRWLVGAFVWLKDGVIAALRWVVDAFKWVRDTTAAVFKSLRDTGAAAFQWLVDKGKAFVDWYVGMPDRLRNAFVGLFDGIKTSFKAALNWVIRKWNDLEFKPPSVLGVSVIPGVPASGIGTPNIPLFAKGGIATKPTLGIFGEAGPEALVPLDGKHGMGGDTINITVQAPNYLGGNIPRDVTDQIVRAIEQHRQRGGGIAGVT